MSGPARTPDEVDDVLWRASTRRRQTETDEQKERRERQRDVYERAQSLGTPSGLGRSGFTRVGKLVDAAVEDWLRDSSLIAQPIADRCVTCGAHETFSPSGRSLGITHESRLHQPDSLRRAVAMARALEPRRRIRGVGDEDDA